MSWLKITDDEWTGERLATEVERRVEARSAELGALNPTFPTMRGDGLQIPPATEQIAPQLYQQLKALNERPPVSTALDLAESPATGIPVIGRLWRTVRRGLHELVLFYVNRVVREQAQRESHLLNIVQELTTLAVQQEQEIAQLKKQVRDAA